MLRKPKSPKWRKFNKQELKANPVEYTSSFGGTYTLHSSHGKIYDGYRTHIANKKNK